MKGIILALLVAALAVGFGYFLGSGEGDGAVQSPAAAQRAIQDCMAYGETYLRHAPSAEWEVRESFEFSDRNWIVRGQVDAPNSFGVLTRLPFACRVEHGLVREFELAGRELGLDSIIESN